MSDPEFAISEPLNLIAARRQTSELLHRTHAALLALPEGAERKAMSLLLGLMSEAGTVMDLIADIRGLQPLSWIDMRNQRDKALSEAFDLEVENANLRARVNRIVAAAAEVAS